ncbi:MAG: MaoC domain protein dehydratase [Conexibacter sp.]|nr:MaoC domain protein dehydratase [Conexibacter sp.]
MPERKVAIAITREEADGPLAIGRAYTFSKTVSESDVYLFAGITGDLHPNHVNEEYMAGTRYGRRIAHGALSVGYMSSCSTLVCQALDNRPAVNYGYDRIRFLAPVFIGDTLTMTYTIAERDDQTGRILSEVTATNQRGELVTVATNILKLV